MKFEGALPLEKDCLGVLEKHRVLLDTEEHQLFIAGGLDILDRNTLYASYMFYRIADGEHPNRYLVNYVTREELAKLENSEITALSLMCPEDFISFIVDLEPENEENATGVWAIEASVLPGGLFPDECELMLDLYT